MCRENMLRARDFVTFDFFFNLFSMLFLQFSEVEAAELFALFLKLFTVSKLTLQLLDSEPSNNFSPPTLPMRFPRLTTGVRFHCCSVLELRKRGQEDLRLLPL